MYFVRRIIFWQLFFRSNKTSLRQIDFRDIEKRGPETFFCTARDIWIIVPLFQEIPKNPKLLPSQKFWKWSFTRVRSTSFFTRLGCHEILRRLRCHENKVAKTGKCQFWSIMDHRRSPKMSLSFSTLRRGSGLKRSKMSLLDVQKWLFVFQLCEGDLAWGGPNCPP